MTRPRPLVRHGLHLTATVLTGGLWAMTGWTWNPRTRASRTEQVRPDGSTTEISVGGMLLLVCLFVAVVSWLWPLHLVIAALWIVRTVIVWTTPPVLPGGNKERLIR